MPTLTAEHRGKLTAALDGIGLDSPEQSLVAFTTAALNLDATKQAEFFPDFGTSADDPKSVWLGHVAATLEAHRKKLIEEHAKVPASVVLKRPTTAGTQHPYSIWGLAAYLGSKNAKPEFVARIRQLEAVRNYLTGIGDGHKLEALAACILRGFCPKSIPTRRGFDQGVDCLAYQDILELERWCCDASVSATADYFGERLHVVASCKANEGNVAGGIPATISPAHVRELIGAWLIQRSNSGRWQKPMQIKSLSPMQLLLVTTYRLSDDSMSLCKELGVAVWGVTELIYLICRTAPENVFPPDNGHLLDEMAVASWIATADTVRLS